MTNAEKFKEVFGYDIDTMAPDDPCNIIDHTICVDSNEECEKCELHDFWNKEFKPFMTVDKFVELFHEIDNINYTKKILVFDEEYTKEELDKIYDLLCNKWVVNKLYRLNKIVGVNGSGPVYDWYKDNHILIEKQVIFVENCDLDVIDDAYDLIEYLEEGYELYRVVSKASLDAGRY